MTPLPPRTRSSSRMLTATRHILPGVPTAFTPSWMPPLALPTPLYHRFQRLSPHRASHILLLPRTVLAARNVSPGCSVDSTMPPPFCRLRVAVVVAVSATLPAALPAGVRRFIGASLYA